VPRRADVKPYQPPPAQAALTLDTFAGGFQLDAPSRFLPNWRVGADQTGHNFCGRFQHAARVYGFVVAVVGTPNGTQPLPAQALDLSQQALAKLLKTVKAYGGHSKAWRLGQ
jgi:hypothetical protein